MKLNVDVRKDIYLGVYQDKRTLDWHIKIHFNQKPQYAYEEQVDIFCLGLKRILSRLFVHNLGSMPQPVNIEVRSIARDDIAIIISVPIGVEFEDLCKVRNALIKYDKYLLEERHLFYALEDAWAESIMMTRALGAQVNIDIEIRGVKHEKSII